MKFMKSSMFLMLFLSLGFTPIIHSNLPEDERLDEEIVDEVEDAGQNMDLDEEFYAQEGDNILLPAPPNALVRYDENANQAALSPHLVRQNGVFFQHQAGQAEPDDQELVDSQAPTEILSQDE